MSRHKCVNISADTHDALASEINLFFNDLSHEWRCIDIQYFKIDCAGRKKAIILLENLKLAR